MEGVQVIVARDASAGVAGERGARPGDRANNIPAVGIVFAGTKADMRPARNISSPVTGCTTASTTRFASQSSASVAWQ